LGSRRQRSCRHPASQGFALLRAPLALRARDACGV